MRIRIFAACCYLFLTACLSGCAGQGKRPVPPPTVIQVPQYVRAPAECTQIHPLPLPAGTSSDKVMELQHDLILTYERQLRCVRDLKK